MLVGVWKPNSLALGWDTFEANLCSRVSCGNRIHLPSPRLAQNHTQASFIPFPVLIPLHPHWFHWKAFFFFLFWKAFKKKKKTNCSDSSLLHGNSLVSESGDYSLDMVSGLLIAMASLVADHGIYGLRPQFLWPIGLVALKIWKLPKPRVQHVSCTRRQISNHWTIREVLLGGTLK